ncbi:MAG: hypothetical protein IRZ11_08695 [Clostridia bacterium]|nr:hypothetical protein [Clostridia bacterium]
MDRSVDAFQTVRIGEWALLALDATVKGFAGVLAIWYLLVLLPAPRLVRMVAGTLLALLYGGVSPRGHTRSSLELVSYLAGAALGLLIVHL